MDKQQAIDYIYQMLDQGHECEEITRNLVDQLHAPEALVAKFVSQTEREYQVNRPQVLPAPVTPQPVKLPPWLAELTIGGQSNTSQMPPEEPSVNQIPNAAEVRGAQWEDEARSYVLTQLQYGRLNSDIADELVDRIGIPLDQAENLVSVTASQVHDKTSNQITNTTEAANFVMAEYTRRRPKLEIASELALRTGESQNLTEKFVALTITKHEKTMGKEGITSANQPSVDFNKPEIVQYVVRELSKNRKRSDIVMALCERTGADWTVTQRFVSQVSAEQHTDINARKNRLIIPMCIGAILLGFVFAIGTVIPMLYLVTGRWSEFYSMVYSLGNLRDYISFAPYIFGTGVVLVAGGIIGLVTAMQSQMD